MDFSILLIIPVFFCFLTTIKHSLINIVSFPQKKFFRIITADYWLLMLFIELPWMIGSFARQEISSLPWVQFIQDYNDHDLFSSFFGLIVILTVELWLFWTPSHLFSVSKKKINKKIRLLLRVLNLAVGLMFTIPNNPIYWFFQFKIMCLSNMVLNVLLITEMGITGVSAVWIRCSFILNLPVQGLGCLFWRNRSDPAAYAKHYKQL